MFFVLMMYLWWSLCTLYLLACQVRDTYGISHQDYDHDLWPLRSLLLYLCDVFQSLINPMVCCFGFGLLKMISTSAQLFLDIPHFTLRKTTRLRRRRAPPSETHPSVTLKLFVVVGGDSSEAVGHLDGGELDEPQQPVNLPLVPPVSAASSACHGQVMVMDIQ